MAEPHNNNARPVAAMDHEAETAWIYKLRLRFVSSDDIAKLAARPPIRDEFGGYSLEGGLGKRLSARTIRRRIQERAEEQTDETNELVKDYRAVSLARLDELSASSLAQMARMAEPIARAQRIGGADIHAEKIVGTALTRLLAIEERRAKLLGADAPVEVAVSVAHYDAEAAELAAILEDAAKGKAKA